jgi:DNA-binding transcriptional LysR family regulator
LQAQLFDRLPRGIRLTDAGRIFEKEASKALEHSHRAISRVQAFNRQKEQKLRIGLSALCDLPRMRTLVEAARKSAVQLTVQSITAYTLELMLALHRGRLDIAVVDLPIKDPGIGLRTVYSETLIAVLPRQHPLAQRPMIRLFELKKESLSIISRHIDSGSVAFEAMLLKARIEGSPWCCPLI